MDSRTFLPTKILLMRRNLYAQGGWTPEASAYVKDHALNLQEITAHAGHFAVCLCQIAGEHFDFFPDGVATAVIEVLSEDAETVIDLVAWPLRAPELFVTAAGGAAMLGMYNMRSTEKCRFNKPLLIHRTPLNWLKANCRGCVVLNPKMGGYWLRQCHRTLLAEDLAHGRQLKAMLGSKFDMKRLLVPVPKMARFAA